MSILIIDDSRMQRTALAMMLAEAGYNEVVLSPSGEDALHLLAEPARNIEIILTDLNMPGMTGIDICKRVKADPTLADLPVLVITSSDESQDLRQAFSAGAMDYITKPINKQELLERVSAAFKLKHALDSRRAREQDQKRKP